MCESPNRIQFYPQQQEEEEEAPAVVSMDDLAKWRAPSAIFSKANQEPFEESKPPVEDSIRYDDGVKSTIDMVN